MPAANARKKENCMDNAMHAWGFSTTYDWPKPIQCQKSAIVLRKKGIRCSQVTVHTLDSFSLDYCKVKHRQIYPYREKFE